MKGVGPLLGIVTAGVLIALAAGQAAPAADGSDPPMLAADLPEPDEAMPTASPPPPRPIGAPVAYVCAGGRAFGAILDEYADQMVVTAGGVTRALPAAHTASGARFARGSMAYWSQGPQALLTGFPGGPYRDCKEG